MKPKLMVIEWLDSRWLSGVLSLDTVRLLDPLRVTSAGFGVALEDRYVLVGELGDDEGCRHTSIIPKASVISVKYLYAKKTSK